MTRQNYISVGQDPYMVQPGSRLEVGPGGHLYETLGRYPAGPISQIGVGKQRSAPLFRSTVPGASVRASSGGALSGVLEQIRPGRSATMRGPMLTTTPGARLKTGPGGQLYSTLGATATSADTMKAVVSAALAGALSEVTTDALKTADAALTVTRKVADTEQLKVAQEKIRAELSKRQGLPGWVIPVAIGGAALLFFALK